MSAATRLRCQKATKPIRTESAPIAKVGVMPYFLHELQRFQPFV